MVTLGTKSVLEDREYAEERVGRGREKAVEYTWERTADDVLAVLRSCADTAVVSSRNISVT